MTCDADTCDVTCDADTCDVTCDADTCDVTCDAHWHRYTENLGNKKLSVKHTLSKTTMIET